MDDRRDISISESFSCRQCVKVKRLVPNDVNVAFSGFGLNAAFLHEFKHAFNAHGKTAGRSIASAQHSDERVVAAAPADCALSTEFIGHPFKDREVVIVQTSDQSRIDNIVDTFGFQNCFQVCKELFRFFA